MKAPQTPATSSQAKKSFQKSLDVKRAMRLPSRTARAALLILLVAAVSVVAALPGSSAAPGGATAHAISPPAPPSRVAKGTAALPSALTLAPAAPFFVDPPIATYAADCTTAKNSFNLGDVVCVKVSGAPTSGAAVVFSDPDNFQRGPALAVTANAQSFSLALPSSGTTGGVDNRGTWAAALVNTDDNSRRALALFTVHDPQEPVADVTISKTALDATEVSAGGNASFRIYLTNQGPDAASNVSFSDNTLPNTTFISFTQDSGPTFTCTPPAVNAVGSTACTRATMAFGDVAIFTAVYKVNNAVGNNTNLTDTVGVTSTTADSHPSSNSSTVETTATNPTNPTCSLTCPANVTVAADTTENVDTDGDGVADTPTSGAHVTLPAAQPSGSTCGTVTSSIPSGSFFPLGSTPVTYTAGDGTTCSFLVTVTSSGSPVSISCPANIAANADADCQTTVTLGTPATTGDNVSVTGARSDGKPLNAPFTSGITTVTWTASNSSGTESCTQTVTIIDVTPPVINVPAPPTAFTDANCQAVIPDLTHSPGITDNCACDSADDVEHCAGHPFVAVTQSPAPGTIVGVGVHTITLTANDGSEANGGTGNVTVANVPFTVADNTPPVISCPANIVVQLPLNSPATSMAVSYPAATATDNCGVASIGYSKASGSTFNVGTTTVTATATDVNGNTASCSFTVSVHYNFTGFFSPIDNLPVLNQVKAGQNIPIKFSLSGNKGLGILPAGSPASQQINCATNVPINDLDETDTPGSSTLTYDAGSDKYQYNWKTEKSWVGQCRQLVVTLNDGTSHTANFKFK
jgi:uncharacterized repeat protein (TIGR01451 family)